MAGNLVSIMAASSKGRGGRQAETLPRFSKSGFSVAEKQNSRFRCTACHTVLPNNYRTYDECPFCHSRNSIITITGRDVRKRKCHQDMISYIRERIRSNPNTLTRKDIMYELQVSYPTVLLLCKSLSPEDLRFFRRKKRFGHRQVLSVLESQEQPQITEESTDDIFSVENEVTLDAPLPLVEEAIQPQSLTSASPVEEKEERKSSLFFDAATEESAMVAFELRQEGYSVASIASLLGVAPATVYWYFRKLKNSGRG